MATTFGYGTGQCSNGIAWRRMRWLVLRVAMVCSAVGLTPPGAHNWTCHTEQVPRFAPDYARRPDAALTPTLGQYDIITYEIEGS